MKRLLALAILWLAVDTAALAVSPWPAACITPITIGQTIEGTLTLDDCGFYFEGAVGAIEAVGLRKSYADPRRGQVDALRGLDLECRAGEIFGLLGQNGAGKTTTILMLLGLAEPSAGVARVVGFDPTRDPLEVKRRVGYLPDNVGFYDGLTGRENLRYTAKLNGISGREAEGRISDVLDQVGMSARADTNVDTYSRGMLQRLGIADALVKDPAVLILDEPTTAIDPIGVVEILDLLRGLVRERGLAVLLSSHLLAQVQSVCDRVGIFAAGKLIGIGTVPELAEQFGEESARVEVSMGSSTRRVARLLVQRSVDAAAGGQAGVEVGAGLSQSRIADLVGVSRESVVRALQRLRDQGSIRTGRRSIEILDLSVLVAHALDDT